MWLQLQCIRKLQVAGKTDLDFNFPEFRAYLKLYLRFQFLFKGIDWIREDIVIKIRDKSKSISFNNLDFQVVTDQPNITCRVKEGYISLYDDPTPYLPYLPSLPNAKLRRLSPRKLKKISEKLDDNQIGRKD